MGILKNLLVLGSARFVNVIKGTVEHAQNGAYFGTCDTAAATAAKVITLDDPTGFELKSGVTICVKFSYSNTASNVTFNVEGTGAKSVSYQKNVAYTGTANTIVGHATYNIFYVYDGTYWCFINNQSNYTNNSNTVPSAQCETAAATAAKAATCSNYSLKADSYLHVNLRYANSAASALTFNVNSKGAKPLYINGEPSSASNHTLPAGSYIAFYNGTNWYFRTDDKLPANIDGTVNGHSVESDVPANAVFVVTPQMFGAKADGSTDDTTAIQDALDSSQYVFFPKGVYIVTSTLTIHRNTRVWGVPAASKLRAGSGFSGDYMVQITDDPSSFLVENIELDCNDISGLGGIFLFRPYNRCVLRDFTIVKTSGSAVFVGDTTPGRDTGATRSQTLLIDNCLFSGSSSATPTGPLGYFYNSFELNLVNTKFLFSGSNMSTETCLVLDHCIDAYVSGCSFAHTNGAAVEIANGTRYFRLTSNTYENIGSTSGYCIYCHGTNGNAVANGYIVERVYYNVTAVVKMSYTLKVFVLGDFTLDYSKLNSYGNSLVSFANQTDTSENVFIGFNGKYLNLPSTTRYVSSTSGNGFGVTAGDDLFYLSGYTASNDSDSNVISVSKSSGNVTLLTANSGLGLTDPDSVSHFLRASSDNKLHFYNYSDNTHKILADTTVTDSLAPKNSPSFTGTPIAPTAAAGTNTTQIASTAFVKIAIDNLSAVVGKEFSLSAGSSCTITHTNAVLVYTDRGGLWTEGINSRTLSAIATSSSISITRSSSTELTVTNSGSNATRICAYGLGTVTIA